MKVVLSVEDQDSQIQQKEKRDRAERGRFFGVVLFTIGVVLGMLLIGVSVYADFESTLFDISVVSDENTRPIRCPIFISDSETGRVSATINNPDENIRDVRIGAHISKGHLLLMREVEDWIQLGPGQSQRVSWEIYPKDAAYGHLILVKVIVYNSTNDLYQNRSCGVIVLNLPEQMKGWHLFWTLFGLAVTSMISGIILWWKFGRSYTGRRLEATRSILGLGSLILVGLISAAAGIWELAAGSFYISVLLIGVIVPHFMVTRAENVEV